MAEKIILDCDPGQDDAIAILLAGSELSLDLLAITVVSGNQTLEKTTINACHVREYLGIDVPIYAGCAGPMVKDQITAGEVHGESGLDGVAFPPLKHGAEKEHAVSYLIRTLRESDGDITLVLTGPMTNLAMAIRLCPEIQDKIGRLIFMGGSFAMGNVTPAAEFNIFADPEAAQVVLNCGRPITMVGLDVTRKVLCYPSVISRMEKIGGPGASLFADTMTFYSKMEKQIYDLDGAPLHDPVTIASLIDPELLTTKRAAVSIDLSHGPSYGRTNCDFYGKTDQETNVDVSVDIDVERFWDIIEKGIRNYR